MLRVVIEVNINDNPQGVKELLAMELERFGDVRVVSVERVGGGQMRLD